MRKVFDVSVTVIVGFIVSMLLNVLSNLVLQPRGSIEFGEPIAIQKILYLPINITNYKRTELSDVLLAIPKHIDVHRIASSQPIEIKTKLTSVGSEFVQHLNIVSVESRGTLELLIPLKDLQDYPRIKPINFSELNLEVNNVGNRDSRFSRALKEALTISIIYSLLFGIFVLYLEIRRDESRANTERNGKQLESISAELKETRGNLSRLKIFLVKQIADYSKELEFWRDTVRKFLYGTKDKDGESERLISVITETLKTYSTRSNNTAIDLSMLEQLIKLREPDNKS